jgi:hypothetical protein
VPTFAGEDQITKARFKARGKKKAGNDNTRQRAHYLKQRGKKIAESPFLISPFS